MATLDYAEIPTYATRLQSADPTSHTIRTAPKILTALPSPDKLHNHSPTHTTALAPPISSPFSMIIPMLLSSSFQIPDTTLPSSPTTNSTNPVGVPTNPRKVLQTGETPLLSNREPLAIFTTGTNFRRFVAKSGPAFWFQDRVEEVVMWRKGWKVTGVWMAGYAFLCYFPRLILLIPHAILLAIILSTHPSTSLPSPTSPTASTKSQPAPTQAPPENSIAWLANMQGIQNLMGTLSDLDDFIHPYLSYITHPLSPHHAHANVVFTLTFTTLLFLLFILPIVPMRAIALVGGLTPLVLTNPFVRVYVIPVVVPGAVEWGLVLVEGVYGLLGGKRGGDGSMGGMDGNGRRKRKWSAKSIRAYVARAMDDDRLEDRHWNSEMREVELWENERWSSTNNGQNSGGGGGGGGGGGDGSGEGGWGKGYLKGAAERCAWTRGMDGWSGIVEDGSGEVSSNLTFSLAPGWSFVETEDWRPDLEAGWVERVGESPSDAGGVNASDDNGWVYTNDVWSDPHPAPVDTWKTTGMTRRRRWLRRIYYSPLPPPPPPPPSSQQSEEGL